MTLGCRGLTCFAVGWLLLCGGAAADVRAKSDSRGVVVVVAARDFAETSQKAADAILSHLSDLPVSLQIEWVDSLEARLADQVALVRKVTEKETAIAAVWADLQISDQVFVFIAEPGGGKILVRSVGSEGESREARLDALGVIVRSSVRAMMLGGVIGVQVPEEEGKKQELAGKLMGASVSYGVFARSPQHVVVQGVRLGLSIAISSNLHASVAYRLIPPVRAQSGSLLLELRPHPLEIGLGLQWRFAQWSLGIGGALLLDNLTWSVNPFLEGVEEVPPSSRWLFAIVPSVSLSWLVSEHSALYAAAASDIYLNERRYVIESGSVAEAIDEPWNVRPWIEIGARFDFF